MTSRRPVPTTSSAAAARGQGPLRSRARAANGTVRTPVTSPRRRSSPVLGQLDEVGTHPVEGPRQDAPVGEDDLHGQPVPGDPPQRRAEPEPGEHLTALTGH